MCNIANFVRDKSVPGFKTIKGCRIILCRTPSPRSNWLYGKYPIDCSNNVLGIFKFYKMDYDTMPENSPDIRKTVEENRGTLKKLQLKIPGLKEYRKLEDIRAADQLLRKQISDKLNDSKVKLEELRKVMTAKNDFNNLTLLTSTISQIQQVSGMIQHAQQGSAGISPNIRIDEGVLNKLYEYDFNSVSASEQIFTTCSNSIPDYNSGKLSQEINPKISSMLDDLRRSWEQRLDSVQNILVTSD